MSRKSQIILLYGSSVASLFIGLISSMMNTRVLSTDDFGDVQYIQNIIGFISSMLLFGYFVSGSRLLAISKNKEDSRHIRGILCILLGGSILALMLILFCIYIYFSATDNYLSSLFLVTIPVCGNVLMLNYINNTAQGDNHITRISMARLLPTLVYLLVAYFIYKEFGASSARMIILYNGIASMVLLAIIISTGPSFKKIGESFKRIHEENKKYGMNVYIGSIAAVSTGYIAGITIKSFGTSTEVAFYTLALSFATPLTMLPSIIGTTYFKEFATENKIKSSIIRNSATITMISYLAFIMVIGFFVDFMYPSSYSSVSIFASWLAIGTSLHGFGDILNRFLGAHGKGQELRNAAFVCGGIMVIGNFVLVYLWGINGAVITKILSSAAYFFTLLIYYIKFRKEVLVNT